MKAIFLDRDGTLNYGIPKYDRVDSVEKVEVIPGVIEGLRLLAQLDVPIFLVTNQAGIAESIISQDEFWAINTRVLELIKPSGIQIVQTYLCPHGEGSSCDCRKPKPAMLLKAASEHGIDLDGSWMVGDRETDVLTGKNAGTKTILVESGAKVGKPSGADFIAKDFLTGARYIADNF